MKIWSIIMTVLCAILLIVVRMTSSRATEAAFTPNCAFAATPQLWARPFWRHRGSAS